MRRAALAAIGVGATVALACAIAVGQSQADASTTTFTASTGTGFSAALSPTGGSIVFDLQGALWTVPVTGGKATAITDPLDEARLPAWSPDGSWITFQAFTDSNFHVWIIRPDGTGLRQLTFGPFDDREPHWSSDGQRIVFGSDRSGNYDLWSVDPSGGEAQRLMASEAEEYFPAWAPDSQRIAFVRKLPSGTWEICVREQDGSVRPIVSASQELSAPSWTADGTQIWYFSNGYDAFYGGGSRLWRIPAAGGGSVAVTGKDEDPFPSRVTWRDATTFVFPSDGKIWIRGRDGRKKRAVTFQAQLTVAPPPQYAKKDHRFTSTQTRPVLGLLRPKVAPNGRDVAFTALGDLWLAMPGGPPRRLTDDSYLDVDPAWSRDGVYIAYVSDRRGVGSMDLYVRDIRSGSERRVVTSEEDLMAPSWSPDGRTIALLSRDSKDWHATYLQLVDVASGTMRQLGNGHFLPSQPSWSADGKTLAMTVLVPSSGRAEAGHNQFVFVSVADGSTRLATPVPGHSLASRAHYGPMWSPDGRHISYAYAGVLWTMPVDTRGEATGPSRQLTSEWSASPSWVGDSRAIVYQSPDGLRKVSLDDASVESIAADLTWQRAIPAGRKIVRAGRMFDGVSARYMENVDIVIDGNVITDIVPRRESWPGAEIVDASHRVVIPGLFQMHVHHFVNDGEKDGRNWLAYGITSVREPGADPYEALERRESWASARRIGPRLFYAGILEGGRVFYWMNEPIVTQAQIALELDRIARLDYDFVKTYERLSHHVQKRIVEFAHANGIPVASHEIYPAAMYGADVVEHLGTTDRMFSSDRISYARKVYDDVAQIMRHSGMAMVPTLAGRAPGPSHVFEVARHPESTTTPQRQAFPERYQRSSARLLEWQKNYFKGGLDYISNEQGSVKRLVDAGICIGTGTDGGTDSHGYSLILEVSYLAAAGLGNVKALQAATIESARITGVADSLGSIERGKLADMVIIDGDPLARITDLYRVTQVIADGRVYDIKTLLQSPRAGSEESMPSTAGVR